MQGLHYCITESFRRDNFLDKPISGEKFGDCHSISKVLFNTQNLPINYAQLQVDGFVEVVPHQNFIATFCIASHSQ